MRALVIGPAEKKAINELIALAPQWVTPLDVMERAHEFRERTGIGTNPMNEARTIDIPLGYSVTYTHEEQPGAICRHMSVSVDGKPGMGPNPHAVALLMEEFGFRNSLRDAFTYLDPLRDGRLVVNVVEPLDGNMRLLVRRDA